MNRITTKQMEALAALINRELGTPATAYPARAEGVAHRANIGHVYWSRAYGGWQLVQITNEYGGVRAVLGHGHEPARIAWEKAHAFRAGLAFAVELHGLES